jgi:hypothetical protein
MPDNKKEGGKQVSMPGMQIVEHKAFTAAQARAITDRIRSAMGDLMGEIARAHLGQAWLALGYESWTDYVKGEFDYAPLALPRQERRAVTHLLRKQGMSTRAIAAVEGVSDSTVREDLSGARNRAPDDEPMDVEFDEDELAEELIAAELPPVRGLDGKTYPTPNRPKPEPIQEPNLTTEVVYIPCPTCHGTGEITQERAGK